MPQLMGDLFEMSSSEARRLIRQGGVKLDGEAVPSDRLDFDAAELDGRVLQVGKRRFRRLRAPG
jgi:tyrosyl-tRNA synthetase